MIRGNAKELLYVCAVNDWVKVKVFLLSTLKKKTVTGSESAVHSQKYTIIISK